MSNRAPIATQERTPIADVDSGSGTAARQGANAEAAQPLSSQEAAVIGAAQRLASSPDPRPEELSGANSTDARGMDLSMVLAWRFYPRGAYDAVPSWVSES